MAAAWKKVAMLSSWKAGVWVMGLVMSEFLFQNLPEQDRFVG